MDLKNLTDDELIAAIDDEKKLIRQLDTQQQALKIGLLNSGYGAFANRYFRYYDDRMAAAITLTGQFTIRSVKAQVDKVFNESHGVEPVFYCDTDSMYVELKQILLDEGYDVQKPFSQLLDEIDAYCEKVVQPIIDGHNKYVAKKLNVMNFRMKMAREILADRAIWKSKKKYIARVWDNEGVRYAEPHLKIMGIQIIQSSTPPYIRTKLKKFVEMLLSGDEPDKLKHYIAQAKRDFRETDLYEIASPRKIHKPVADYVTARGNPAKGCPVQIAGVIAWNKNIQRNEALHNTYGMLSEEDNIRFIYLKQPNPLQSHVLSFAHMIPAEWDIEKWVDYSQQFDKTFNKLALELAELAGVNLTENTTFKNCF